MPTLLDMSQIELPDAVEELDYETLRLAWLTDYAARMGVSVSSLDVNDPIVKGLEVGAYREMLVRARINDAVRRTMLASAYGPGLDDLGADPLYNTPRLILDPGDPDAVPPVPPVKESDDDYRARLALAPAALSVAGPANAYEVRAKGAHGDVVDVAVTSPNPCEILVEVLHNSADPDILTDVADALTANTVRPIGDRVTVVAAIKQTSSIDITVYVGEGPDLAAIEAASQARIDKLIQPIASRVRSAELLSLGDSLWTGAAIVEGVLGAEVTAQTGMTNPAAAWWPLTINVTGVRV